MLAPSSPELDHCRELALRPGSVFEFTSRFLQADKLEPLLAVYALKQAICSIPNTQVDDSVKWEKLKWWGEELLADPGSPARHPVLRALHISGARSKLHDALILQLVSDAIMQIDMAPFPDEQAMFEWFSIQGQSEVELELALDGAGIADQNRGFLGGASALLALVESFAPGKRPQTESLPLNLLAKFNVTADDLGETRDTQRLVSVISELTALNLKWYTRGFSGLEFSPGAITKSSPAPHLQLRWTMEKRRLQSIDKDISGFLQSGTRFGLADAWFAWRFMRKLARQSGRSR